MVPGRVTGVPGSTTHDTGETELQAVLLCHRLNNQAVSVNRMKVAPKSLLHYGFLSLFQNENCSIDYIVKSDHERNNMCSFFNLQTIERVKLRKE